MTKRYPKFNFGNVLGLYLTKDHREKIRVENCTFSGKYLKKGHREFGVSGNVILQKSPAYVNY